MLTSLEIGDRLDQPLAAAPMAIGVSKMVPKARLASGFTPGNLYFLLSRVCLYKRRWMAVSKVPHRASTSSSFSQFQEVFIPFFYSLSSLLTSLVVVEAIHSSTLYFSFSHSESLKNISIHVSHIHNEGRYCFALIEVRLLAYEIGC